MRALLYYNQRDIRLEDVAIPVPAPGQVLLRVTDAGLCQTQINEFIEGPFIISRKPHKRTGKSIPIITGHEFGGIVEKCGAGIENKNIIGSQVAVLPLMSCGTCYYCKKGFENRCDDMAMIGLLGENGGFAEYACVNIENIFPVQDRNLLTFIEPILIAIDAACKINDSRDHKRICILGAGAIGLSAAAVFRDFFGAEVVINDILPNRLRRAKLAGFETLEKDKLQREYDIVIDCAGSSPYSKQAALIEGLDYLIRGGILLNMGTYFHPVHFIPSYLLINEQQIITSFSYTKADFQMLPEVLAKLQVDFSLVIERISLDDIIEGVYYRAEVDMDSFTRLVVVP